MKLIIALTTAIAIPLFKDVHETNVQLVGLKPTKDDSRFIVQVSRQDTLSDDMDLKAVKSQIVLLSFDVKNDQVLLNDKPVVMGVSTLQVEAQTLIGTVGNFSMEEAMKNLYVGIVDVEIEAKGFTVEHNGLVVRRLVLTEKITAINGEEVEQEEMIEQILQVFPDGTVSRIPSKQNIIAGSNHGPRLDCMRKNHHKWGTILTFAGVVLASIAGFYFALKAIIGLVTPRYEPIPSADLKEVRFDEKKQKSSKSAEAASEELPPYDPEFKA